MASIFGSIGCGEQNNSAHKLNAFDRDYIEQFRRNSSVLLELGRQSGGDQRDHRNPYLIDFQQNQNQLLGHKKKVKQVDQIVCSRRFLILLVIIILLTGLVETVVILFFEYVYDVPTYFKLLPVSLLVCFLVVMGSTRAYTLLNKPPKSNIPPNNQPKQQDPDLPQNSLNQL